MTMNEFNDLTRQSQKLIAEARRLRLKVQHAMEELEEIRQQAERHRFESRRRRVVKDAHVHPGRHIRR